MSSTGKVVIKSALAIGASNRRWDLCRACKAPFTMCKQRMKRIYFWSVSLQSQQDLSYVMLLVSMAVWWTKHSRKPRLMRCPGLFTCMTPATGGETALRSKGNAAAAQLLMEMSLSFRAHTAVGEQQMNGPGYAFVFIREDWVCFDLLWRQEKNMHVLYRIRREAWWCRDDKPGKQCLQLCIGFIGGGGATLNWCGILQKEERNGIQTVDLTYSALMRCSLLLLSFTLYSTHQLYCVVCKMKRVLNAM